MPLILFVFATIVFQGAFNLVIADIEPSHATTVNVSTPDTPE